MNTRSRSAGRVGEPAGVQRSAWSKASTRALDTLKRRPFIFGTLVVFFGLYYYRPEDFIKPLAYIPMAKVAGGLGFFGLIFAIAGGGKLRVPRAIKILWLLLVQMTFCIPLSLWPGNAFGTVFGGFAKGVVVAMLIGMSVVTVGEIRKLLWIQASAIAGVTFLSIAMRNYGAEGRLSGIQNSILANPNDLAINIAITFPLALAFLLRARGPTKIVWAGGLAFMGLGVVLTGSRSGLLALIISISVCVWEYGVKGKRRQLVVATIVLFIVGFSAAMSSSYYRARVLSIVMGKVQGESSEAVASAESRKELLKLSVMTALTHPILGIGPGCFSLMADAGWKVAHNAYTELAAESGIPALVLFLMALGSAFKNIVQIRKSPQYRDDPEFTLFTQALWAGLAAYMTGSFFASTEYNLYPYFVIGYTCAMVRITSVSLPAKDDEAPALRKIGYTRAQRAQVLWTR
ncbi:MAG: O-antigen ligase family protein [Candidatus Sulfotelmatobacter sp.]